MRSGDNRGYMGRKKLDCSTPSDGLLPSGLLAVYPIFQFRQAHVDNFWLLCKKTVFGKLDSNVSKALKTLQNKNVIKLLRYKADFQFWTVSNPLGNRTSTAHSPTVKSPGYFFFALTYLLYNLLLLLYRENSCLRPPISQEKGLLENTVFFLRGATFLTTHPPRPAPRA